MTNQHGSHVAFDDEGNKLDLTPEQVREKSLQLLSEGELLVVISRIGDDLAINVMGKPSVEIFGALQQACEGYRKALDALGL